MNPDDFSEREFGKDVKKNTVHIDEYFYLMNFISSRSNARDYERMCKNLSVKHQCIVRYGYQSTIGLQLSGTPLNESIILLNYMIPEFKKAK